MIARSRARTVARTERWILVLMAGRLGGYMAVGIEADWSVPNIVMVRLKALFWVVGIDIAWRHTA